MKLTTKIYLVYGIIKYHKKDNSVFYRKMDNSVFYRKKNNSVFYRNKDNSVFYDQGYYSTLQQCTIPPKVMSIACAG
jgi:hypothetical protein